MFCVIFGGVDLKCPANSNQNNGLKVYSRFLDTVAEFQSLESLPASVKFTEEHDAEVFFQNQAKWHKTCHLKFALPSYFDWRKENSVLIPPLNSSKENQSSKKCLAPLTRKDVSFAQRWVAHLIIVQQ